MLTRQDIQPHGDEPERARGGIVHIEGHAATLADGSRWWLIGEAWAMAEARAQMSGNPNRLRSGESC
jgi:hypothetical protein